MIVLKGDKVRTSSGDTGEVVDTWGVARSFICLLRDSDGKRLFLFGSAVTEVIERAPIRKGR